MTTLAGALWLGAVPVPVIALLTIGGLGHGVALLAERYDRWAWRMGAAATAQAALLVALAGVVHQTLMTNDPSGWLPASVGDSLRTAAGLTLIIFLVAGYWWRSPGLGVTLPAAIVGLLLLAEMGGAAAVTRGLPLATASRAWAATALTATLALAVMAAAGQMARWLERGLLGAARFGPRVLTALLVIAASLLTAAIVVGAWGWFERGRLPAAWTVQLSWLLATWLALLLAAEAAWRERPTRSPLALIGPGLLAVSVGVVAGLGPRG